MRVEQGFSPALRRYFGGGFSRWGKMLQRTSGAKAHSELAFNAALKRCSTQRFSIRRSILFPHTRILPR